MTGPARRSLMERLAFLLQRWTIRRDNEAGTAFATIHHRPKRADDVGTWSEPSLAPEGIAVAMQGPLATEADATYETLKLYTRLMPGARLVLGTWRDQPAEALRRIERLGVEIVLCDKPPTPGLFNVNLQITSAAAAVRRAVEGGAEWVLKTRTDQRLYAPNALAFLRATAEAFPVAGATRQRRRVIGVGQGSLKYAPYHVTDQTVFGHAEDMLLYWTPPLREEDWPEGWPRSATEAFLAVPVGELCRRAAAECYLASRFLERLGRPLDWSLADSWAAYRDHFCFVDFAAADFYWIKGQTYSQREHSTRYDVISNREEMLFRDWLLLHAGWLDPSVVADREAAVYASRFNDPVPPPG